MGFPGIWILRISGFMKSYGYPIAGYGDVCMPDDSNKAGAAESAPEPFESNKISIFYLTRKGSGQASDSNGIPHALLESSVMQTVPYPVIGYPYNPTKTDISKDPIPGIPFTGPMAQCPILPEFHSPGPMAQWPKTQCREFHSPGLPE